jgi:Tfp pilus assembly protein PilO
MKRRFDSNTMPIDLAALACLLALGAMVYLLGIQPVTREREARDDRARRAAQLRQQCAVVQTEILTIRERIERDEEQIDQRRLRLLTHRELNPRLSELIEHASRHQLGVLTIKPGERTEGAHHGRTPIDMELSGLFPDFVRYLHEMRRDAPDLVVRRIEIRAAPGGDAIVASLRADWLTRAD